MIEQDLQYCEISFQVCIRLHRHALLACGPCTTIRLGQMRDPKMRAVDLGLAGLYLGSHGRKVTPPSHSPPPHRSLLPGSSLHNRPPGGFRCPALMAESSRPLHSNPRPR